MSPWELRYRALTLAFNPIPGFSKLERRSIREGLPPSLARWRGNGVISRLPLREIAEFSQGTGIPVVDLNEQPGDLGLPLIFNDQQAIGRMAAEHLLERGFTQFGYIGQRGGFWSDGRRDGFAAALAAAGHACDEFLGVGRHHGVRTHSTPAREVP